MSIPIRFDWTDVDLETGYRIHYTAYTGEIPAFDENFTEIDPGSIAEDSISYIWSDNTFVGDGTQYAFYLTAVNDVGSSAAAVDTITTEIPVPELTLTTSWDRPGAISVGLGSGGLFDNGYLVERSVDSGATWTVAYFHFDETAPYYGTSWVNWIGDDAEVMYRAYALSLNNAFQGQPDHTTVEYQGVTYYARVSSYENAWTPAHPPYGVEYIDAENGTGTGGKPGTLIKWRDPAYGGSSRYSPTHFIINAGGQPRAVTGSYYTHMEYAGYDASQPSPFHTQRTIHRDVTDAMAIIDVETGGGGAATLDTETGIWSMNIDWNDWGVSVDDSDPDETEQLYYTIQSYSDNWVDISGEIVPLNSGSEHVYLGGSMDDDGFPYVPAVGEGSSLDGTYGWCASSSEYTGMHPQSSHTPDYTPVLPAWDTCEFIPAPPGELPIPDEGMEYPIMFNGEFTLSLGAQPTGLNIVGAWVRVEQLNKGRDEVDSVVVWSEWVVPEYGEEITGGLKSITEWAYSTLTNDYINLQPDTDYNVKLTLSGWYNDAYESSASFDTTVTTPSMAPLTPSGLTITDYYEDVNVGG